jgi:hypothetical protein
VNYQLCRWYDPYPRLAFALKLLYLAPGSLQNRAAQELQRFLGEDWGSAATEKARHAAETNPKGKRWYDEDFDTAQAVELIKISPESMKSRAADTLLEILIADCA